MQTLVDRKNEHCFFQIGLECEIVPVYAWVKPGPHLLNAEAGAERGGRRSHAGGAGSAIARQPGAGRTGTKRWRLRREAIVTPAAKTMTSGQIGRQASKPRQTGARVMKAARPRTAHEARTAEIV